MPSAVDLRVNVYGSNVIEFSLKQRSSATTTSWYSSACFLLAGLIVIGVLWRSPFTAWTTDPPLQVCGIALLLCTWLLTHHNKSNATVIEGALGSIS